MCLFSCMLFIFPVLGYLDLTADETILHIWQVTGAVLLLVLTCP